MAGLVVKGAGDDGYDLTPAGRASSSRWCSALADWGARHMFGDPRPEELDPETLMWWFHGRIDTSEVERRAVVQVEMSDRRRTYWLVIEPGDASVCHTDPGYEIDAVLRSDLATLYRHVGGRDRSARRREGRADRADGPALDRRRAAPLAAAEPGRPGRAGGPGPAVSGMVGLVGAAAA